MSVRSLLSRVARLEQARIAPRSPLQLAYGSLDAYADEVQAGIDAGTLDRIDMPIVLACIRRWHSDGAFGAFGRGSPNGVWGAGR